MFSDEIYPYNYKTLTKKIFFHEICLPGTLFGIANTLCSFGGFSVPVMVGYMTNGEVSAKRIAFADNKYPVTVIFLVM